MSLRYDTSDDFLIDKASMLNDTVTLHTSHPYTHYVEMFVSSRFDLISRFCYYFVRDNLLQFAVICRLEAVL